MLVNKWHHMPLTLAAENIRIKRDASHLQAGSALKRAVRQIEQQHFEDYRSPTRRMARRH
jgi:hypothetical protein